jgi:hypothetical protein
MHPRDPDSLAEIRARVLAAARERILFLPYAIRQMSRADRMITAQEVRRVVMRGEIVEDHPDDARGHSCLMMGAGDSGRIVHVVCTPKAEYLAAIASYLPDPEEWTRGFRVRRES